jgi:hypothetical protein
MATSRCRLWLELADVELRWPRPTFSGTLRRCSLRQAEARLALCAASGRHIPFHQVEFPQIRVGLWSGAG